MQSLVYADQTSVAGDGTSVHPLTAVGGGGTPGGANTDVQYNDSGAFGGNDGFYYDKTIEEFGFVNLVVPDSLFGVDLIGAGSDIFLSAGTNGQCEIDIGNTITDGIFITAAENNPGNGGISIVSNNASGSGNGINVEDDDAAGGIGVTVSSLHNEVNLYTETQLITLGEAGSGMLISDGDPNGSGTGLRVTSNNFISVTCTGGSLSLNGGDGSGNFTELKASNGGDIVIGGDNSVASTLTLGFALDTIGFFGHATAAKQAVTGSKGGNAALTSLMAALAAYGFVTDSTT